MTLEELASSVTAERTCLLLGAGASVPSGAPTGSQLAADVSRDLRGRVVSNDLQEVSTMLEQVVGRPELVKSVRNHLKDLQPSGGLLALPEFSWRAIYTTNFDRLVEQAYRRVRKPLIVVRSNFEYAKLEQEEGTPFLKLHGCISQDAVDGQKSRLVLTEDDYAHYEKYRLTLFARLGSDLAGHDVLVVGQSLADTHLQAEMRRASEAKHEAGAPGRLLALIYEDDPDRAAMWERRGFLVATGDIDTFLHALTEAQPPPTAPPQDPADRLLLKPTLRTAAIDVDQARARPPDPVRMFNGRAASYPDVVNGMTFDRSARTQLQDQLSHPSTRFVSIIGAAGVGKTTLARQLVNVEFERGTYCWEHPFDYPLKAADWLDVDSQLKSRDNQGVLLIDNCGPFLRPVNRLVSQLARDDDSRLKLVLTASAATWKPRLKDRALFAKGEVYELSTLSRTDISNLVRLANEREHIKELVEPAFAALPPEEQERRLRERARADMYVCLKNIFANEQLDDILLQEFAELGEDEQDVYRFVCALEAMGGRVHRQLVLRLLSIDTTALADLLERLEGVVEEYTISANDGLYGWATRHEVIARTIAGYKYSAQEELRELLSRVVDELNPTVYLEMRSLREMCNSEFGIASLRNVEEQLELFQRMVANAPAERVPRHRVIRGLLRLGRLDAAAQAIRQAEEAVGDDRPIHRYKVRLAILRAEQTPRIMLEDRLAILHKAEDLALEGIQRFRDDRLTYSTYASVGEAVAKQSGDLSVLDAALQLMNGAYDKILDPEMGKDVARFERVRADHARRAARRKT